MNKSYKSLNFKVMATNQKKEDNQDQKGSGSQQGNHGGSHGQEGRQSGNHGNQQESQSNNNSGRGFAGMDDEQQREIASKGGKAAHESGNAHEFNSEEAREAGRKGGQH
jgi:general stress protein YciG